MRDSTSTSGWHTVGEIVVPGAAQEHYLPQGANAKQKVVKRNSYGGVKLDSLRQARLDSVAKAYADSVAQAKADSAYRDLNHHGLIIQDPYATSQEAQATPMAQDGISWLLAGLMLFFTLIGFKFKNSPRYLSSLSGALVSARVRGNMFDNTVKESSFLIILNAGWCLCAGIMLWYAMLPGYMLDASRFGLHIGESLLIGVGVCTACVAAYMLFKIATYWVVGNVFYDSRSTQLWVRGATASWGLQSLFFLPLVLLLLCMPAWGKILVIILASVFIFFKILFIYKGIRIFWRQNVSWMIFLYYLCSLEIVPLILVCVAALNLCAKWG